MLLGLVQHFLRAKLSLEFGENSIKNMHYNLHGLGSSQVRPRLYLHCTDRRPEFSNLLHLQLHSHMLLVQVQNFLRATVNFEFAEISIKNMHYNMYYLGFSQLRQRLYLHCTDLRPVFLNSLNLQPHSHMLLVQVQNFLRATVSFEFAEISIKNMHYNLYELGFSQLLQRLYFHCTDRGLIFFNFLHFYLHSHVLLDLVQPFLRAAVNNELAEISIR